MAIRYDPVGQCIYCGTKEPPIDREHIIPFGLGGEWILPEASCKACAAKTGAIEQYVLRNMFGDMRNALGFRTRRPKERPTILATALKHPAGHEEVIEVPPEHHPASFTLARLPPARVLRGLPDDGSPVEGAEWWTWYAKDRVARLMQGTTADVILRGRTNPSRYSQMLAKIAHSFAVAQLGLKGWTPLAIDLALGRTESMNYLVGAQLNDMTGDPATEGTHRARLRFHTSGMILAEIRLFASLGAPIYHVLVGLKEGGRIVHAVEGI